MLKIGDFSKLTQVSGRTLRYYDELGLLKPQSIDPLTGYRYYTFDQMPRLNRILALKDLGFELERIADLLDLQVSTDDLHDYLREQEHELELRIHADEARLQRVRNRLAQIDHEHDAVMLDVVIKQVDAQAVAGNRVIVPTIDDIPFFARHLYKELYGWLRQHRIAYTSTQLVLYHAEEYIERDYDMEVAVFLPGLPTSIPPVPHAAVRIFELPAVTIATTLHQGRLKDADRTARDLFRWCDQNGYAFLTEQSALREIHLFEPSDNGVPIPRAGLMELQLPVVQKPR